MKEYWSVVPLFILFLPVAGAGLRVFTNHIKRAEKYSLLFSGRYFVELVLLEFSFSHVFSR